MELSLYKKFSEQERFNAVVEILKENGIEHSVTEDRESLDSLYGDKHFKHLFFVKIKKEDFEKVDNLLLSQASQHLESVEKEHYLFSFTNEELHDIISKPDEWNEFDFLLAQKILQDRGISIDQAKIKKLKDERIRELAKPDEKGRVWIVIGYFSAMLGGILGILIGWHLSTFKKTLPNGQKVFGYTTTDRSHGNRILILGIAMLAFWIIVKVITTQD